MNPAIRATTTGAAKSEESACWLELDNLPGCYLWNHSLRENETATWSDTCSDWLAEGTGEISSIWGSNREFNATDTGQLQQGKRHGQWSDLRPYTTFDFSFSNSQ